MLIRLEEAYDKIKDITKQILTFGGDLNIDKLKNECAELEEKSYLPGFWDDQNESKKVLSQIKQYRGKINSYDDIKNAADDINIISEMAIEDEDESLAADILNDIADVDKKFQQLKTDILLSGEYDSNNAIITFHPGAGGTEAQDWAEMLYRMYTRWAERHSFKYKILDYLDGDEAGIKSAAILVEGLNAYGYLKGEKGIHRLVRISPFDSSGRRHTSFASIDVMPEFADDIQLDLSESDLKIEAHRASGAGGQHINKTDSAVRVTHIPTGIVTNCQTERSQMQNRETAIRMLKSKLLEIKEREHLDKIEDIQGIKLNIEWGSQIRSYTFMPYTLVKDHRTNFDTGNIIAVMDGDIDDFINSYLTSKNNNS